jgi:hypothetical protein
VALPHNLVIAIVLLSVAGLLLVIHFVGDLRRRAVKSE